MHAYQHQISGIFQQQGDALVALATLKQNGMSAKDMRIDPSFYKTAAPNIPAHSNRVFNQMLLLGCLAAFAGVLLAVLTEWRMIADHSQLLHAGLIVSTLALTCLYAALGMMLGAIVGATLHLKKSLPVRLSVLGRLLAWVHALIANRQMKLSVNTYSPAQTALVAEVMHLSVNHYRDIRLV